MMKKTRKSKKGFTLVELMVVVAILGVLVAVAIPVYNGMTEKAEMNTCRANIRTIESAIMQAEINGETLTAENVEEKLVPKYLKEWPKCPTTNNPYKITVDAQKKATVVECTAGTGNYKHNS
ncbi:MAG: prepilin-type N-terminal cleavage/methylation domain-containing protein [Oscillospiraceae bacterium]